LQQLRQAQTENTKAITVTQPALMDTPISAVQLCELFSFNGQLSQAHGKCLSYRSSRSPSYCASACLGLVEGQAFDKFHVLSPAPSTLRIRVHCMARCMRTFCLCPFCSLMLVLFFKAENPNRPSQITLLALQFGQCPTQQVYVSSAPLAACSWSGGQLYTESSKVRYSPPLTLQVVQKETLRVMLKSQALKLPSYLKLVQDFDKTS
jgi:hypothetical protein